MFFPYMYVHKNGPKWSEWSAVDTNGLNWTKRNEVDRMDKIGLNGNKVDQTRPNRIEVDRIGPKWTV